MVCKATHFLSYPPIHRKLCLKVYRDVCDKYPYNKFLEKSVLSACLGLYHIFPLGLATEMTGLLHIANFIYIHPRLMVLEEL